MSESDEKSSAPRKRSARRARGSISKSDRPTRTAGTSAENEVPPEQRARREPENAIREYKTRTKTAVDERPTEHDDTKQVASQSAKGTRDRALPASAPQDALTSSIPADVAQRFVRVGQRYYFPDGARAFTDHGRRLSTPSENTEVIRSLVRIAQVRGWQDITLSGIERFRKEAWMAARLAGLGVRGYQPTEFEQQRLVRALARVGEPHSGHEEAQRVGDATRGSDAPRTRRGRTVTREPGDELITGRLTDHGRAPYRHNPNAPMSYFVSIETARGDRTLWGVDLERAFKQSLSQPAVGDEVGLRKVRREPVTIKTIERDLQGEVIGNKEVAAHRNRWIVEQRSFFDERAAAAHVFGDPNISSAEGARQHPQLLGSYLQLRSAQELAGQRILDPQDQQAFVGRVRQVLADMIAQGEPLKPVRLRERAETQQVSRPQRSPARDNAPAR